MDSYATKEDGSAGQGMAEACQFVAGQQIDDKGGDQNHGHHGADGHQSEYSGHH